MAERTQTVAGAYDKIEGHEGLCAERYARIHESITEIRSGQRWVLVYLVGLVGALMGWMGVQLYALEPLRVAAAARVETAAKEARGVVRSDAREARAEVLSAPPVKPQP